MFEKQSELRFCGLVASQKHQSAAAASMMYKGRIWLFSDAVNLLFESPLPLLVMTKTNPIM